MPQPFYSRHIGPAKADIKKMLEELNCSSLEELIHKTAHTEILNCENLDLPPALSETECLHQLNNYAIKNKNI